MALEIALLHTATPPTQCLLGKVCPTVLTRRAPVHSWGLPRPLWLINNVKLQHEMILLWLPPPWKEEAARPGFGLALPNFSKLCSSSGDFCVKTNKQQHKLKLFQRFHTQCLTPETLVKFYNSWPRDLYVSMCEVVSASSNFGIILRFSFYAWQNLLI